VLARLGDVLYGIGCVAAGLTIAFGLLMLTADNYLQEHGLGFVTVGVDSYLREHSSGFFVAVALVALTFWLIAGRSATSFPGFRSIAPSRCWGLPPAREGSF
jgi:uncharacterized membrane protein